MRGITKENLLEDLQDKHVHYYFESSIVAQATRPQEYCEKIN